MTESRMTLSEILIMYDLGHQSEQEVLVLFSIRCSVVEDLHKYVMYFVYIPIGK